MKAIVWNDEALGAKFDDDRNSGRPAREGRRNTATKLIEAAVELDDDAHGRLPRRQGAGRGDAEAADPQGRASPAPSIPVLCGSAFKNKGVQPLLDAVVDYLPSPLDVPRDQGHRSDKTAKRSIRKPDDNEPLSLLAFKIMDDPFVGTITFCRIYSGTLDQRHRR